MSIDTLYPLQPELERTQTSRRQSGSSGPFCAFTKRWLTFGLIAPFATTLLLSLSSAAPKGGLRLSNYSRKLVYLVPQLLKRSNAHSCAVCLIPFLKPDLHSEKLHGRLTPVIAIREHLHANLFMPPQRYLAPARHLCFHAPLGFISTQAISLQRSSRL